MKIKIALLAIIISNIAHAGVFDVFPEHKVYEDLPDEMREVVVLKLIGGKALITLPKVKTLQSHTAAVYSVAWSPDGTQLASASRDKTIKIWNTSTGEVIQDLQGHTDSVNSVAWSPDGTQLASGSADKTIKIWRFPRPVLTQDELNSLTIEQALFLLLLYKQWLNFNCEHQHIPLNLNHLHEKISGDEARAILHQFSQETQERLKKHFNLIELDPDDTDLLHRNKRLNTGPADDEAGPAPAEGTE